MMFLALIAASSSWRAFSAAASFFTLSRRLAVSLSVPVRTARWQPRLINVISDPMWPVLRA